MRVLRTLKGSWRCASFQCIVPGCSTNNKEPNVRGGKTHTVLLVAGICLHPQKGGGLIEMHTTERQLKCLIIIFPGDAQSHSVREKKPIIMCFVCVCVCNRDWRDAHTSCRVCFENTRHIQPSSVLHVLCPVA